MDSIEFKGFSIRGKNDRRNTVYRQTTASSEEIASSIEEQAASAIEFAQYTN
ncbi:hypothetical protein [Peribacillus butanolivorans]|uniref:hypothetical protein n=1 Tax=Peribacillus butanolivorans TaxID=421767 RepID=UPI0039FC2B20